MRHINNALLATAIIALAAVMCLNAQDSRPRFEVASVKPANSGRPGMSIETEPGRFKAINVTVSFLIQYAYGLKDFQLSGGPGWIGSDKFDIDARSEAKAQDVGDREFLPMMRTLLADRFQLKFRRETKELPVYALTVAKNGPKLTPAPKEENPNTRRSGGGQLTVTNGTVANLASALSNILGRTVVENTGLTGSYDITLKWTPDEYQAPPLRPDLPPADPNGPSIFTALQEQLGLKLESARGPVEVLVIDSVSKPTEN